MQFPDAEILNLLASAEKRASIGGQTARMNIAGTEVFRFSKVDDSIDRSFPSTRQ